MTEPTPSAPARRPATWTYTVLAVVIVSVVGGLFVWQQHRVKLIAACAATGGSWDGRRSRCLPPLPSPILRRDLQRT